MNALRFLFALLFLAIGVTARAQFTIAAPEVVSETRVSRTVLDYTMRAKIVNTGATTAGITATLTIAAPHTSVVKGSLNFGTVPAAASTASTDTFVIRHDRAFPFDPAVLHWTIKVPFTIWSQQPTAGASEVGVTVRPQVLFSQPVDVATLNANNFYATFSGQKLAATIVPANDGRFAWLFFTGPMPSAAQVQVTVDGSTIRRLGGAAADLLDAAGNGTPGSKLTFDFSTVSIAPVPATTVSGRIVDPGPDLLPHTADDAQPGPDGKYMTADDVYLLPIAGVKVHLIGLETQAVFTDANGYFQLPSVPSGNVKVVIDGRTATVSPAGYYFPEMVMDAQMSPGVNNSVMAGMPTMYLPRIPSSILAPISASQTTMVTLKPEAALDLPLPQQQFLSVEVQPNSLVNNGQHVAAGQVGISVVPPELVRDMLPPGLLQHTLDITVQAPGITNFSTPAAMTFPNVFNAPPGTKLNFLSFDHTTGRLVIEGTAPVSPSGLSASTDPGTGITHPGWHGLTPPGSQAGGDGNNSKDPFDPCGSGSHNRDLNPNLPQAVLDALSAKNRTLQNITNGYGDYLYDNYDVTVQMPNGMTPEQFLANMTKDINGTVNNSTFNHINTFSVNPSPKLGDIYHITITGVIPADVVLSKSAPDHFRFTTLNGHPEFGAREFGFEKNSNGTVTFYTRGASRPRGPVEGFFGGYAQTKGWEKLTEGIGNSIKNQGGAIINRNEQRHPLGGPSPCFFNELNALAIANVASATSVENLAAPKRYFYHVQFSASDTDNTIQEISGVTDGMGHVSVFLAANATYVARLYNPVTKLHGETIGETSTSGIATSFGSISVGVPDSSDTDGDGLGDFAEFVIGTNPNQYSTAGDGISDGAKVEQGLDPLAGIAFPTGIIASIPLVGEAKEVVLEGSTTNSRKQTAYVAAGSGGLEPVMHFSENKAVLCKYSRASTLGWQPRRLLKRAAIRAM